MMNMLHKLFLQHSPRRFAGYVVLGLFAFAAVAPACGAVWYFNGGGGTVNGVDTYTDNNGPASTYDTSKLLVENADGTQKCTGWYDLGGVRRAKLNGTVHGYYASLTAKWVEDRYPVFFVSNTPSPATNEQSVVKSEKVTLAANTFTRQGYRFVGWSTDEDAKSPMWTDGQSNVNLDQYRDKYDDIHRDEYDCAVFPVTLYAVWEKQFTIKFDKNGGTGTMDDLVLNDGESRNLPHCSFTPPAGAKFNYWSSDFGSYQDKREVTYSSRSWPGEMAVFKADWTPISYKVAFSPNCAVYSGTMADQPMDYGTPQQLMGCQFKRVGYDFSGWAELADGAVKYGDKADVVNLSATDGAIVNLYARWAPIGYAVKFDAAGGEGEMAVMDCEYDQAYPLLANVFTRDGGTFVGWTTNGASGVVFEDRATISNLSSVANSTNVLRAVWSNIVYHIAFDGNGGEGSVAAMDCEYGTVYQLPSNDFSRTGYVFAGWATNATSSASYAEGESISNLTSTADATVSLFAAWRPITYRVVFDANGGEGTMDPVDCTYDVAFPLPANSYTRLGRAFSGWALTDTGDVVYEDGETVSNLSETEDGECRLYAVWIKELGDLNAALDNNELTMLRDSGSDAYVTVIETNEAVNGTCVKINRQAGNDGTLGFRIYLDTPGELTFRWKVVNVYPGYPEVLIVHKDGFRANVRVETETSFADALLVDRGSDYEEPEIEWEDVKVLVTEAPANLQFLFKGLSGNGSTQLYALFDNVRWTSSENPEPTPEDAPVINGAATVEGGRFRVTFAADKRFKYELIKTESLSPVDWQSFSPQLFLTPDEDGNVSFEPDVEASEPQMFYRVKVLKKD